MNGRTLIRAVVAWIAIVPLAVLNGAVRDAVLTAALGPAPARMASGVALCFIILAVATLADAWMRPLTDRTRWRVGALWMALTLGFETSFAYFQHHSWQRLLDAYTFQGGDLWPLVLATTLVAPWAAGRIRVTLFGPP